jgi:RNA polymerase sigma-70 factor, ECF subfamily
VDSLPTISHPGHRYLAGYRSLADVLLVAVRNCSQKTPSPCQDLWPLFVYRVMALSQEDIVRALFTVRPRISASVWLVVRDTQTAEDIFQDTSIKALTRGGPFETVGQLLSWAQVTARHAAIDWLRRRRPEWITLEGDVLDLLESQATLLPEGARVDALRECLETVPPRSRQMLELRYFDGRSCDQVAETLGIKLSAVYQRLSRLHGALKECIERRMAGNPAILNPGAGGG